MRLSAGCDFMHAKMLAPETIHLAEKHGYKTLIEVKGICLPEFQFIHGLESDANGDLIWPDDFKARIEDYQLRFGDKEPRTLNVCFDLRRTK